MCLFYFFGVAFLAAGFLAAGFFVAGFLAGDFLAFGEAVFFGEPNFTLTGDVLLTARANLRTK